MLIANIFNNFKLRKLLALGLSLLIILSAYSAWRTYQALVSAKRLDLQLANTRAKQAKFLPQTLSKLTLGQVAEIEIWNTGLETVDIAASLANNLDSMISNLFTETSTDKLDLVTDFQSDLESLEKNLNYIRASNNRSFFAKKLLPLSQLDTLSELTRDFQVISSQLLSGEHTYILVFQNSDELRASGGFIGSYADVKLVDGVIEKIDVRDIYEPDGQFTGYVVAPPGVAEYLSSDRGLRLPDANWYPDFATSAQTILNYFAFGQKNKIEGVVAINLEVAEHFLEVFGDQYLADYNLLVTRENLSLVARADRSTFFPGSQQKKNFLSALFNQLKFKTDQLTAEQKKQLLGFLANDLTNKNIQFYSNNLELQSIFEQRRVAGQLIESNADQTDFLLYLLESNVGINKANRDVTREVEIDSHQYSSAIHVRFNNGNVSGLEPKDYLSQTDNLHYVNYQRLITHPEVKIQNIVYNRQTVKDWDEHLITNVRGEVFKEIGFLITVPEQEVGELSIEIYHPPLTDDSRLLIKKQPGLPATPYTVRFENSTQNFILEKDETVNLE